MWFMEHAWLVPLVPGVGFALTLLLGKRIGKPVLDGAAFGIASLGASFVLSLGVAVQWIQHVNEAHDAGSHEAFVAPVIQRYTWWQSGGVKFTIGSQVDGLSVTLMLLVSFISLLIHIYSLEYVRADRRFTHFFASLTLFSA